MKKMKLESPNWKNKLSVRIPLTNALIIFVVIVTMCGSLSILLQRTLSKTVEKEVGYIASENAQKASSYLEIMNALSKSLSQEVQRYRSLDKASAEVMLEQSLRSILNDDRIFGAYYAFEPNLYFGDTPAGLSYYAFRDGSNIGIDINNDYDIYATGDYYLGTKEQMKTHVTQPYEYTLSTGEVVWLITLSNPIIDSSGNFLGVANCDIITDSIETLDYTNGGYSSAKSFILTDVGTYLADSTKPENVGTAYDAVTEENVQLLDNAKNGKQALHHVKNPYEPKEDAWIMQIPITLEGTDVVWSSVFVVNKSEALAAVTNITFALTGIGIVGLILLTAVSGLLLRRGLSPLSGVISLAEQMGRCELQRSNSQSITSKDELGQLAGIFDRTSEVLGGYISEISLILNQLSQGDLNAKIQREYVGDFAAIKDALTQIITALNTTFKNIGQAAEQVSFSSTQVSNAAQNLSQGATEQASSIEELAGTIHEISSHINETAENSADAQQKTDHTVVVMTHANEKMQALREAMDAINVSSGQIGKIIKTIEDIAFQTNILALNAAVEAARAGAAGKGFAVVADEVRNLASKSAEAAKDTTQLIAGSIESIERGNQLTGEAAASMLEVVQAAQQVTEIIKDISDASQSQATAVNQVTLGMDQISGVVQQNSATAQESAAASEELSGQAQILQNILAQFRM